MHPVIAIDGPSASGKSTAARLLAERLAAQGFNFVSTGVTYRAVTWFLVKEGIFPAQGVEGVLRWLSSASMRCWLDPHTRELCMEINGENPMPHVREPQVNANLSQIAAIPQVRERLVELQRALARQAPLVAEGRDMGTVVFPETPYKFFIDADPKVRAARRAAQGEVDDVARRDALDSTRAASPLVQAPDAVRIDSTHVTPAENVEQILEVLREKGFPIEQIPAKSMESTGARPAAFTRAPRSLRGASAIYKIGYHTVGLFCRLLWRTRIEGMENVPAGRCVIAANHVSFLDPPIIGWALGRPLYYFARSTLFKPPIGSWLLPRINCIPVNREQADLATMRRVLEVIRQGHGVVLFPEGTRSPNGALQPAKAGPGWIASKANVPIVPVRIFGSYEAWPRGKKLPRPNRVRVVIGRPFLPPAELLNTKDKSAYQKLSDLMMREIAALG